jgi:16S rRNA (guanine527-N7)-methyltransferase
VTDNLKSKENLLAAILPGDSLDRIRKIFDSVTEPGISRKVTALTDWESFLVKIVLDGLLVPELPKYLGSSILDLGSGGGFPGMLLAMVKPGSRVTLLDSVARKGEVASQAAMKAGIANVEILTGRAEDLGRAETYRASFDTVTAKAVAPLPVLLELTMPFLQIHGRLLAYKGPGANEEIEQSANAMKILGGHLEEVLDYSLPAMDNGEGPFERKLLVIRKTAETPFSYPRRAGIPRKKPL